MSNYTPSAGQFIGHHYDDSIIERRKKEAVQIHILDHQTDEILETISEKDFWEDIHRETIKNEEIFDFITHADGKASEYLYKRNRVIIPMDDGFFRELIIDESILNRDSLEVYSTASYLELAKDKPIAPTTINGQTVSTAADYVLRNTGWELGISEYAGIRKITFEEYITPYKALKQIASTFDRELRFRIETSGNKVIGRYVDMVERRGIWRGREIVSGKDLINAKRTEQTDRIVTALVGIGPEREDGTREVVEVTNGEARQAWGRDGRHLWAIYEPQSTDQGMTKERLTTLTENELQKRISAAVQYEVEGADLEHIFGREHEKVRLGDDVRIKATEYNPPIYLDARIIAREGSIKNRTQKNYTLGEFIEYSEADINALKKQLQKQIANKAKIVYSDTAPGDIGVLWVDTSVKPNIIKHYDKTINEWVRATPINASEVGAEIEIHKGPSAPSDTTKKWIDTSVEPNILKQHNGTKWVKVTPTSADEIKYADLSTLESLQPASKGADVTGNNTSKDTSNVNGRPSANVDSDAKAGKNAKDKIDTDVGTDTIETTTGASNKADQAESDSNAYTDNQLTNYVESTLYSQEMSELQAQIDNQITSHFKAYEPTFSNEPASLWTTTEEKNKHIGDLFYNTGTGYSYRFALDETVYKWILVRDEGISKALADAAEAQDTADSKRRVFVSQPTTPYDTGDLWDNNGTVYRSTVTKTSSATFSSSDWYLIGDVTGENTSNDVKVGVGKAVVESGADKTSNNTASDTTNVNGRPSANVDQDAQKGSEARSYFDTSGALPTTKLTGAIDTATNKVQASSNFYWEGGSLIAINPTDTQKMVRISSEGIGVSTDGGVTYSNALTGDGVIAEMILAGIIKGVEIQGGKITSDSSINVTTDLYVGDNIFLGDQSGSVNKTFNFSSGAILLSDVNVDGVPIIKTSAAKVHLEDEIVLGYNRSHDHQVNGKFITSNEETGWMGIGGWGHGQTGTVLLEGVNFKINKTYVPSSITYDVTTAKSGCEVGFTDISEKGFSLTLTGGGHNLFVWWRGYYTA